MKELQLLPDGLKPLTEEELININAGDGFWYDVAYGIGKFAKMYANEVGKWGGSAA